MAKKNLTLNSKNPAARQRRSGGSATKAEDSAKRAAAGGKKINPITGARQPKQPPRKLAVGNCANCGCSQLDTCLWRTHPSPDADGGKVKLCNACGIHIRDKGYNRKVTPEMLQRQASQAQATRRAWAIRTGQAEADSDNSSASALTAPPSPASSDFSNAGEAPPSPVSTKATSPSPAQPTTPRKNSPKASPKASPKSPKSPKAKASRKAAAGKGSRPAPLKLIKSAFDTAVQVVRDSPLPSPEASEASHSSQPQQRKEVALRPKPQVEDPALMSVEEAASILLGLVNDAWRHHNSRNEAAAIEPSSDAEGSERSFHSLYHLNTQPNPHYARQQTMGGLVACGMDYYLTPGPEKGYHGFGEYQAGHQWSDDPFPTPAPYGRRDSLESASSVNIITPPITPVLCNNSYVPVEGGKVFQPEQQNAFQADLIPDYFFRP